MTPYDINQEATGCTNELFYRNGSVPQDVRSLDAEYVHEIVSRYLTEAYEAGRAAADSVVLSEENDRLIAEIARLKNVHVEVGGVATVRSPRVALWREMERQRYEAQRIAEGGRP